MLRSRIIIFSVLFFSAFKLNAGWNMRSSFIQNNGQVRTRAGSANVYFILSSPSADYYFTDKGYSLVQRAGNGRTNTTQFDFDEEIMHHRSSIAPEGKDRADNVVHYVTEQSSSVAAAYSSIIYRDIFDGCDLVFSINGDELERSLVIKGSTYPFDLMFHVSGSDVQPIEDESKTGYTYSNSIGSFTEELSSHSFFEVSDVRSRSEWSMDRIDCDYELRADLQHPQTTSVITWLTYLGGSSSDELFSLAVTPDSGAVVAGRTSSLDFPATPGAYCDTFNLNYDIVLARFASNGNCMWCTYYGGNDFDGAYGVIPLDTNYLVCGSTNSTSLPMVNPYQPSNAGSYDGFLAIFSPSGSLLRSTYYGGTGGDQFFALALDTSRRICVAGSSSSANFPNTAGHFQPSLAGAIDATLAVFDQQLNPVWATYYGGSNTEDIHAVTTSSNGEIIIAGGTYSNNFPITANAYQAGMLSMPDCYLVKFGMDGTRHYGTFFGGTNSEDCNGVVADSAGGVYVTGFTYSVDFPIMGNSFQSNHAAQTDVFVSKFDAAGQMTWSTFLGGAGMESGMAMERKGKYLYVDGNTESTTFPVSANAIQAVNAGSSDGFVVKMDTAGNMVSGTFMGGNGVDALYGIGVTDDTCVIACGTTYSTDLDIHNAYQSSNMLQGDGYVVKFGMSEENLGNGIVSGGMSDARSDVSVFPVPVSHSDQLHFSVTSTLLHGWKIYDSNGRMIRSAETEELIGTINVTDLAAGKYIIVFDLANSRNESLVFIKD